MHTTNTFQKTTLFLKLTECALAALAIVNTLSIIIEILPEKYFKNLSSSFWNWFLIGEVILGVLVGVSHSIYWHKKEKKKPLIAAKYTLFYGALSVIGLFQNCVLMALQKFLAHKQRVN